MVRRLTIAYRGAAYAGWQRQKNALTVQAVVEQALSRLAGEPLHVVGASRTDAGVHARGQVAHVAGATGLPDRAMVHGTIALLPEDVRILEAVAMRPGFHARRHALGKRYSYTMERVEVLSPLRSQFAVRVDPAIDVDAMNRACRLLAGEHDFSAFALSGGSHQNPRRRIFAAECLISGTELQLQISGDGFLRGMVRSIAGTLIEVGLDRFSKQTFAELLDGAPRAAAGPTAPPQGLVLEEVVYDPVWTLDDGGDQSSAVLD